MDLGLNGAKQRTMDTEYRMMRIRYEQTVGWFVCSFRREQLGRVDGTCSVRLSSYTIVCDVARENVARQRRRSEAAAINP